MNKTFCLMLAMLLAGCDSGGNTGFTYPTEDSQESIQTESPLPNQPSQDLSPAEKLAALGEGDVDLHAYEPSGKQVYYADKKGDSGFLDVDNTSAYGPEHYYASCNKNELREGEYAIKLANYERAQGRTATVQLASWDEGVLSTRYHTFGAATGSTPSASIFNVVVSKDAETQEYKLSYQ